MAVEDSTNTEVVNNGDSSEQEVKIEQKEQVKTVPISELISERKKRQEYEKKLREIEEADIIKKGEFETLANKYKEELESLKGSVAEKEALANKWVEYENKKREEYKSLLGDMPNFDSMSLEQLDFLGSKLKAKVPDTDVSVPKPKTTVNSLTESEKKQAKQMFMGWADKDAFEAFAELKKKN